ncbi:MAG: hypothetical protein IPM83_10590 [Ignavibacteria bacterium]|nr:hypothetical protein [Ignavibacteria bacterium]
MVRPLAKKMMQKIEDLRKMRLLDVLNLQGDQVEKFSCLQSLSGGGDQRKEGSRS